MKLNRDRLLILGLFLLFFLSLGVAVWDRSSESASASLSGAGFYGGQEGIGYLQIFGPIYSSIDAGPLNSEGVSHWVKQLKDFEDNMNVKALLIRVNSPGGTVGASQELYAQIERFKTVRKIPVVVSVADVSASGAYWASLAADTIFANRGSMVGNIGVIMSFFDFTNVKEKYGVGMNVIKSGKHKDILSSWRDMSDEESEILNNLVGNVHDQFVEVVAENRQLDVDRARTLADGRIYTGDQAVELGLIDQVGTLEDAVAYTAKQVGLKGDPVLIKAEENPFQNFMMLLRKRSQSLFQMGSIQGGLLH